MAINIDLSGLQTERRNPNTVEIDNVPTLELCQVINNEDAQVARAVEKCLPEIARAIDSVVERVQQGGRVIYVGAGTSGRLGVLDASELPPTFTANPQQFIALIAGGDNALRHAQEGAEDNVAAAVDDLKSLKLHGRDSLIGIAASGRTPYVLSCLAYARPLGCCTIGVSCSHPSVMSKSGHVEHMISAVTGPEVVTGSTRLKAGTATKLILNMLSTRTMIKTGKTFGNIMIDVKATNLKLKQRSRNILRTVCGDLCPTTDSELDALLRLCDGSVKLAVASLLLQSPVTEARERLAACHGVLSRLLNQAQADSRKVDIPRVNGERDAGYILCVDGGGSKCAAVIRNIDGESWQGEGGPCNPTDVGIENAVSSIIAAVQTAVNKCPVWKGRKPGTIPFAYIWVGVAGYDRPSITESLNLALEKLFSKSIGRTFRVSTDIELLVTAAAQRTRTDSVTALVAGTGSIAMNFSRDQDQFLRTGRSGGWGYILGDDGSGFDVGKRALRHCLAALDLQRNESRGHSSCASSCLLCQRLLDHFAPDRDPDQAHDLLSTVISPTAPAGAVSESSMKKRIASIAPIVIELSETNPEARSIIDRAIQDLVELIRPLQRSQDIDPARSALVLAGGLFQSEIFQVKLKRCLANYSSQNTAGPRFGQVICVPDPATAGAECMVNEGRIR